MQKRIYEDYAELVRQKKHVEEKLEELKPLILADLSKDGLEKFQHERGTFSVTKIPKWEYSPKIAMLQDALKDLLEIAEKSPTEEEFRIQTGETESLRFQQAKGGTV